ncbi:MAG TPA: hypothetical protein PJ982_15775 [Lacipirellulaceae bacterium]|nr:hypothetical protein [Lacipirellulaceae bacterium]
MSRQLLYRVACSAVCAAAFLAAPTVEAQVFYNDGGVHVINGPSDKIEILNGPGNAPTTVTVEAPAVVGASSDYSVNVRDSSVFNMTGGTLFDELFMFNNSTATISGGQIGDDITTNDNASIVVHYVKVLDDVEATGNSLVTIYDGDFDEDVEAYNSAVVNIFGGMFQTGSDGANIEAADNSTINIHGGAFGVRQRRHQHPWLRFHPGVIARHWRRPDQHPGRPAGQHDRQR